MSINRSFLIFLLSSDAKQNAPKGDHFYKLRMELQKSLHSVVSRKKKLIDEFLFVICVRISFLCKIRCNANRIIFHRIKKLWYKSVWNDVIEKINTVFCARESIDYGFCIYALLGLIDSYGKGKTFVNGLPGIMLVEESS